MDDVQEKEKSHREGGASKSCSWPRKRGFETHKETMTTHT
jgi:hypothetical protein